jgi:hypothetical protein
MRRLLAALPEPAKRPLRWLRALARRLAHAGNARHCPICGCSSRKFLTAGVVPRQDARCPHCGSLERHRLLWLFLNARTDLFDGRRKRVLHVAPETCLELALARRLGDGYLTADLLDPKAMVRMDITDIRYPDGHFDVIYCSHVLEHVPDDRKAMREFHRVLRDDGWAALMVPLRDGETHEDPSITDPEERTRAFGQPDHVRSYGRDFPDRLVAAGFRVESIGAAEIASAAEATRMGLNGASGEIFLCRKADPDR